MISAPAPSTRAMKSTLASSQPPPSSSLPRQSIVGLEIPGAPPSSLTSPHHHSSFTTSPASFLNHHANRLKSKLVPNTSSTLNALGKNQVTTSSSTNLGQWTSQKNTLIIMANAAAIELYFLCIEDEADAEKLCTKCSEKFFLSNMSLSDTILQAPLIASCIQVLKNRPD